MGASFDDAETNAAFAEKHGLPFPLICDESRSVALAFGACDAETDEYPRRYTFVISGEGIVEEAIDTRDPGGQAESLLRRGSG